MIVAVMAAVAALVVILLLVLIRFLRTRSTGLARTFAVVAMVALPGLWLASMLVYADAEMKKVSFCLSCHEMDSHGRSLTGDEESLVAAHYVNNRVDQHKACYTCHTNPGLPGYVDAKLRGLHDVRVHYFGGVPEELELVHPFRNAVCLKCHGQARSFLENPGHQYPDTLIDDLRAEEASCLDCHYFVHDLEE